MNAVSCLLSTAATALALFLATALAADGEATRLFRHPERVALVGYEGDAMEPFMSRDGRFLLFNNQNDRKRQPEAVLTVRA
jgi:hypothetical protein